MVLTEDDFRAQLEERLQFETLLADLSAGFVGLPSGTLDREIENAQRRICQTLGLDRSTLTQFVGPNQGWRFTHSWAISGLTPNPLVPVEQLFPWLLRQVQGGQIIQFTSVDELPAEAATDKQTLRRLGPKSNLTFPLMVGGNVLGALSFGALTSERQWPDSLVKRLRLIAEVLASALARRSAEEALRNALKSVESLKERLEAENVTLRQDLKLHHAAPQIIGRGEAMQRVLALVEQVAATDSSVLLLGETGTGKELIASAIHEQSTRRDRPMIRVNCAAIPSTLVESELFGREKGAYTGALTRQIGRFEAADHSTLFLDEIGDLPPEVQVKLLRFLQDRQIERLGSPRPIPLDVRIIAATNCDLPKAIRGGGFREDLYYRLSVFPIVVPPLRERREDIPVMVRAFAEQFAGTMGKLITSISQSNLDALQQYDWPGNVRELRNVIERAVILASGPKLTVEIPSNPSAIARPLTLADAERDHILRTLELTGWRVQGEGGAAALLGLKRTTLESRMAKLGIRRPERR